MTVLRSPLLKTLSERGFIHQCTDLDGLDAALSAGSTAAFVGFDAAAGGPHAGHLLPIMVLRWLQRCGHKPVVLIGGGMTQVGGPRFRNTGVPVLEDDQVARNVESFRQVLSRYLVFGEGPTDALVLDSAAWLEPMRQPSFLHDVGTHFTVNRMLTDDSLRQRLEREQPLTLLEFNYMVLQAFDFVELARRRGCMLQIGSPDQWTSIISAIELARRVDQRELFGLAIPLLATAPGLKAAKKAGGTVWLSAERLEPSAFWQSWRNTDDDDVARFLRLFTEIPLDEVRRLAQLRGAEINVAKEVLATEVTRLAHGDDAMRTVTETPHHAFRHEESATGRREDEILSPEPADGFSVAALLSSSSPSLRPPAIKPVS